MIPPEKRQAVLDLSLRRVRGVPFSERAIARQAGVSRSAVRQVLVEVGPRGQQVPQLRGLEFGRCPEHGCVLLPCLRCRLARIGRGLLPRQPAGQGDAEDVLQVELHGKRRRRYLRIFSLKARNSQRAAGPAKGAGP